MGFPSGTVDTFLHLGVFLAGAVTVAVVGLFGLERLGGAGEKAIGKRHLLLVFAGLALLVAAERLFHVVT